MTYKLGFFAILIAILFSSCNINSNLMLKTPTDYVFDSIPSTPVDEYVISENDIISFQLFSNDGFKLVDVNTQGTNKVQQVTGGVNYLVEKDGQVKFPTIKRFKISGLTIKEAEKQLEELYRQFYIDPFVILKVINKRVLVFPGKAGDAKVVSLENNNTTVLEVIALAGGISDDGKAKKVKLIREVEGDRKVFLFDLSKIEGLKYGDVVVQANDIIYIEPASKYVREVSKEIAPIIAIISAALIVITAINAIN